MPNQNMVMDPLNLTTPELVLLGIIAIWELVWKGIGMWKSARNKEILWFLAILIINSVGILPLIYLFFFDKSTKPQVSKRKVKRR